jgi:23S rRNA (adenine2030-N6)-methyltransferase
MLSYRHGFHAGNHADVLKHLVLVQLTRYLGQKEKAFWYVDTHAGAGAYALDSAQAAKLAEHREGIGRLWGRKDLPLALGDYLGLVRAANPDGRLKVYPGSPALALSTMRVQDRLRLFELHSREVLRLRENFQDSGKRVLVEESDGFAALKALLPPPPRRALVLIDPPYEERRGLRSGGAFAARLPAALPRWHLPAVVSAADQARSARPAGASQAPACRQLAAPDATRQDAGQ